MKTETKKRLMAFQSAIGDADRELRDVQGVWHDGSVHPWDAVNQLGDGWTAEKIADIGGTENIAQCSATPNGIENEPFDAGADEMWLIRENGKPVILACCYPGWHGGYHSGAATLNIAWFVDFETGERCEPRGRASRY